MDKPDCYKCKHRGTLSGSAHSKCRHPSTNAIDNPANELIAILASVGRISPIKADCGLNVKGDPHGIQNGWFNWPFSYDPVWLISCDGFDPKETGPKPALLDKSPQL